jgi:murein DD-endopeptidase MepM/ murein hydrolase activator NlpD
MVRRILGFTASLAVLGLASTWALQGTWPWQRLSVATAPPIVVSNPFRIVSDTLHRGETVGQLFQRQGVQGLDLRAIAASLSLDPRSLRAGLVFQLRKDPLTDQPSQIEFRSGDYQRLQFIRTSGGDWRGEAVPIHWAVDTMRVSVEIRTTLYDALDAAISDATLDLGERAELTNEIANVNAYSVDFSRDIQAGDRIAAVVERRVSEYGDVRFGRVLASELAVSGKTIDAFYYEAGTGKGGYYDANGSAVRRQFLLAPVEFRYISSGFSRARMHPILGIVRRHEGVDYRADKGTQVMATADGVVLRAGWNSGGYGNLIEVRHTNGVTTRYGHLSRIAAGVRPGTRVSQGQVIGYVGMTGLATAPHLHYEFRVNGVAQDPRRVKSRAGDPLPKSEMLEFRRQEALLAQLLDSRTAPAAGSVIAE